MKSYTLRPDTFTLNFNLLEAMDKREVKKVLSKCKMLAPLLHPDTYVSTLAALDTDEGGSISYEELKAFTIKLEQQEEDRIHLKVALQNTFDLIDYTSTGVITRKQLLRAALDDMKVQNMIDCCPGLAALIRPRTFEYTFQCIAREGTPEDVAQKKAAVTASAAGGGGGGGGGRRGEGEEVLRGA